MSTEPARPPNPPAPVKVRRSRGGCNECRRLHRKCDEAKPVCRFCREASKECVYGQRLSWGGRPFGKSNPYLGSGMERMQTDEPSPQRSTLDRSFIYTMAASPTTSTPPAEQRPAALEPTPSQILASLAQRAWLPARSRQLIEHFIKHMGGALSLTREMHDELCSVILPMALGADSHTYLLSAVLCLAGTHRLVLGLEHDESEHVAWRHECIVSMQRAIAHSNGNRDDTFIAAALLICYSDILEGGEKPMSWSLHLRGALAKLGQADQHSSSSPSSPQPTDPSSSSSTTTPRPAPAPLNIVRRHLNLRCASLQTLSHFCAWNSSLQTLEISDSTLPVGVAGGQGTEMGAVSQLHGFAAQLTPVLEDMHLAVAEKAALKRLDARALASATPVDALWQCLDLRATRMLAQVRAFLEPARRPAPPLRFQTTRATDWNAALAMSPLLLDEWACINEAAHHACIVFILCELKGLHARDPHVARPVARGLWCMRQLEIRSEPCPAAALLLPLFIIGCETTAIDDRAFVLSTVDKVRKAFGKANARNAGLFLETLWQRRDHAAPHEHVSVADLMDEKGWNLSLK